MFLWAPDKAGNYSTIKILLAVTIRQRLQPHRRPSVSLSIGNAFENVSSAFTAGHVVRCCMSASGLRASQQRTEVSEGVRSGVLPQHRHLQAEVFLR